jgi:hypothetical protein
VASQISINSQAQNNLIKPNLLEKNQEEKVVVNQSVAQAAMSKMTRECSTLSHISMMEPSDQVLKLKLLDTK